MRALVTIAALLLSMNLVAAEHRYIVPMVGYAIGQDGTQLYAYTVVTNLSPRPATIRTVNVYPLVVERPCPAPADSTLAAGARIRITPMLCMDRLSAFELVSDEPLSVRTELDSKRWTFGSDRQLIPAPTEWIPAGTTAVTEAIIRDDSKWRANLLIINPNDHQLLVDVEVDRPEVFNHAAMTVEVAAHSSRIVNIPEVRRSIPQPFISSGEGRHLLKLTANGPFQAGMSSVSYQISMWVPATPLVP